MDAAANYRLQISDFRYQTSGFKLQITDFRFQKICHPAKRAQYLQICLSMRKKRFEMSGEAKPPQQLITLRKEFSRQKTFFESRSLLNGINTRVLAF
jgi:hypothetical protein